MVRRINPDFIKRKYYDLRWGYSTVSPLVAFTNFILLGYNFTNIKDVFPFWSFTIFFVIGMVSGLMIIGLVFRKHQYKIDKDLEYERSRQLVRTQSIILKLIIELMEKEYPFTVNLKEAKDRLIYLTKIMDSKI